MWKWTAFAIVVAVGGTADAASALKPGLNGTMERTSTRVSRDGSKLQRKQLFYGGKQIGVARTRTSASGDRVDYTYTGQGGSAIAKDWVEGGLRFHSEARRGPTYSASVTIRGPFELGVFANRDPQGKVSTEVVRDTRGLVTQTGLDRLVERAKSLLE